MNKIYYIFLFFFFKSNHSFSQNWKFYNIYNSPIKTDRFQQICQENEDIIWFRTSNYDGIYRFENNNWHYYEDNGESYFLYPMEIFTDKNKKLWVLASQGLSTFDGKVWTKYPTDNNIMLQNVFFDKENNFYLTSNNGVLIFKDGKFSKHITGDEGRYALGFVDSKNNIWSSRGSILYGVDNKGNLIINEELEANIIQIYEDANGLIWILSTYKSDGFVVHNVVNNKLVLRTDLFGIWRVFQDSNQNLWFMGNTGYKFYSVNKGKKTEYYHIYSFLRNLYPELDYPLARDVIEDNRGRLWFNFSPRGIGVYDPNCNSKLSISKQPENIEINESMSGFIEVNAENPNKYVRYQWQMNDGKNWLSISNHKQISNQSSKRLNIENIDLSFNSYKFRCIITDECNTILSEEAVLKVNPLLSNSNEEPKILFVSDNFIRINQTEKYIIKVYSITGKEIITENNSGIINLKNLSHGIYIANYISSSKNVSIKFYKE